MYIQHRLDNTIGKMLDMFQNLSTVTLCLLFFSCIFLYTMNRRHTEAIRLINFYENSARRVYINYCMCMYDSAMRV